MRPDSLNCPASLQCFDRLTVALMLFPPFLMAWPTRNPPAIHIPATPGYVLRWSNLPSVMSDGYPLGMRSTPSQTVSARCTNSKIYTGMNRCGFGLVSTPCYNPPGNVCPIEDRAAYSPMRSLWP